MLRNAGGREVGGGMNLLLAEPAEMKTKSVARTTRPEPEGMVSDLSDLENSRVLAEGREDSQGQGARSTDRSHLPQYTWGPDVWP